ncbi:hypothetical protein M885DRAFT_504989 [Pelagophyceae sp. CCMP2097]|nr:hypothetical protein M885DRAFT_504989 [Pelagophyceae sp. CCMP2097]|mmetsp:Transcript_31338/g.105535  ORF Transcript_31338/g.105535 Transcript_31338/m.105535 type:complete len:126 (-) Transcript_31338:41-418(-)
MGGGNAQKSAAAREKNLKEKGQTDEDRAASRAKQEKDKAAFKCAICLQTFLVTSKPEALYLHVTAKHDKEVATPEKCFPSLKGFDPNKPVAAAAAAPVVVKKKVVKKDDSLNDMLSAGLAKGKKK